MKNKLFLMAAGLFMGLASAWAQALDLSTLITNESTVTYTVTNDETYPWSVIEGALTSDNRGEGNTASWVTLNLTVTEVTDLTLNYFTSTENGYDKLHIDLNGTEKVYSGNTTSGTYSTTLYPGENVLKFGYTKDGSGNSGDDLVRVSELKLKSLSDYVTTINMSEVGILGEEAVAQCGSLTLVKGLKIVGPMNSADWATLKNMTGLRYLDMTETTVTEIPESAFSANPLYVYYFPANLKTIGASAFSNKSNLVGELVLPETVESIGNSAFSSTCYESAVIPASVKEMGTAIFQSCSRLLSVDLQNAPTSLPTNMFRGCSVLKKVSGIDNVTVVNSYVFYGCQQLNDVGAIAPITVADGGFRECKALAQIDLSRLSTVTGNYAFYYCSSLTNIELPNIKSITSYSFQNCTALTSITIGDKISTIPYECFYGCNALETVVLGASVRSLGGECFYGSDKIASIYINAPAPPTVGTNPFKYKNATLYVPEYAMTSYKLDTYFSAFTSWENNPNPVSDIVLYGSLSLTSNTRIPGAPNLELGWPDNNSGSSFVINGNNEQTLGTFRQYITNAVYSSSLISRCNAMTSTSSEIRFYCGSSSSYWYYVTMPFDVNMADVYTRNGASFACRYYDSESRAEGNSDNWKDMPADGKLLKGQAYIFCVSSADYICMPATDNTHNDIFRSTAITTNLSEYASEVSADAGWNLVGNPYPAFYDIYYMDYTAPITVWNTSNRTFTAYSVADDELVLFPLQGFFVQKPNNVDGITFQTTGRQTNTTVEHGSSAKSEIGGQQNQRRLIDLTLSDGSISDRTRVVVNAWASDSFEAETDASKMFSYEAPQFYSIRGNESYAINEGSQKEGSVQLGMWIPAEGKYTIDCTRSDVEVKLYDNGQEVAMPYSFNAEEGTNESRFVLSIGQATGIESVDLDVNDKLYNLAGQRMSKVQKGVYINNGKKVIK